MDSNQLLLFARLFESLEELDRAIHAAMLEKQEAFAIQLYRHAKAGRRQEVPQLLQRIRGLSGMIRDDARELIAVSGASVAPVRVGRT